MNLQLSKILAIGAPGINELIVILLIIVILFGAKKIPDLARGVGRGFLEFRRAKREVESETLKSSSDLADLSDSERDS